MEKNHSPSHNSKDYKNSLTILFFKKGAKLFALSDSEDGESSGTPDIVSLHSSCLEVYPDLSHVIGERNTEAVSFFPGERCDEWLEDDEATEFLLSVTEDFEITGFML